jgi:exodeoxyribonuclease V alpha subunit
MSEFDAVLTVRRTRFTSEETGWAVVEALDDSGGEVVLVGPLSHLEDKERARIRGIWVNDARYGPQVKVSEAHPLPPADEEALGIYLRRVKHVGSKRADKLIAQHGAEHILDAIDRDPAKAFLDAGLTAKRAEEAAASWDELRATRQLHMMLAPYGLAYLVKRIQVAFGPAAGRIVNERPYALTSVFGVGFLVADRIARRNGAAEPGLERTKAAVLHVLSEAERSGSTCMPAGALLTEVSELLRGEAPSNDELETMIEDSVIQRAHDQSGEWIYRTEMAELEAELAARIDELTTGPTGGRLRDPLTAESQTEDQRELTDGLTQEQRSGVRGAFVNRLSLITGGPGTGKTASIKAIANLVLAQRARVQLVAPTGRAAIRMTEASGVEARTVHSALGWVPGEGPTHDEDDPLDTDLLIVDECSMANLELMVTLLRAVGPHTHVVLVGDADQLAPVGAGKPFAELIQGDAVPNTKLTHIFRQAAGSMIVQAAHSIRRGETPNFQHTQGMRRDLFMIDRGDPVRAREEIVSLVAERLPSHYGVDPVSEIQVFAPVYRGDLGIDALNLALRERLNPDGRPVRGGRLRIGDKLMMTGRNLHELGLMNGTVLRLLDEIGSDGDDGANDSDDAALLLAAEESVFRLPPEESEALRLAYACSVHRGQGIELPVAVIVAHPAAGAFFLRREMLYTAITRARLATVIVGSRDVLARAARTPDTGRRHTRLVERMTELTP